MVAESEAASRRGDRKAATDLALSAYLDGVEPIEPALGARDSALMRRVEAHCGLEPHSYQNLAAKVFPGNAELSVPAEARAVLRERLQPQFAFIEATFGKDFAAQIR